MTAYRLPTLRTYQDIHNVVHRVEERAGYVRMESWYGLRCTENSRIAYNETNCSRPVTCIMCLVMDIHNADKDEAMRA